MLPERVAMFFRDVFVVFVPDKVRILKLQHHRNQSRLLIVSGG